MHNKTKKKQQNRCNVKHRSCRQLSNTSFSDWFSGGNNFYSSQFQVGEKQSKWCSECVPPRSAALARQIHHPDTQRVISWGLGNTAATRGIPRWKRGNCTQRHDPLHARSTNYTLDWSKTHEPAMYTSLPCNLNPPQPEKCWQPGSQLASI